MSYTVKPNTFQNGQTADGTAVNANFDAIFNDYNGNITDVNIAASGLTTYGKVQGSAIANLANVAVTAGILPAANLPSIGVASDGTVNPTNLLSNGDFESWSAGASAVPDGYSLAGAGASVAREATIIKSGTYSAKVTRSGADATFLNSNYASPAKGRAYYGGRTVTFSCWVYATVANRAVISLYDGNSETLSSYHTGNSTWQLLSVTKTLSSNPYLQASMEVLGGDTSAYFDGAMCVEGSSAFAFSPKPAEEGVGADYSANSTIVGWGSFTSKIIYCKKVGNIANYWVAISGVSNSASATITLPYACKNITTDLIFTFLAVDNTTSRNISYGIITAGSANVTFYPTPAAGGWTSSNNKTVYAQFSCEVV